jgi:ferritin-like protein
MTFETNREVLDWYESQPRTLTEEFIGNIAWKDVKNYPLDKRLVPVLLYMRDVEVLTDMYYKELRRTPTGKDPIISKFMERWGIEETAHGEVINRFLSEAGIEASEKWKEQVFKSVSRVYTANAYLMTTLTNFIGKKFTATHMTFGAIHEMSTAQGYRRLMKMADHPILTEILTAIMREESAHTRFYASVARIELGKSEFARKVARFIVNKFWAPVGQGAKPKKHTDYTIGTLFSGKEGFEWVERNISQKIQSLPGFGGLTKITDTVAKIQTEQFV